MYSESANNLEIANAIYKLSNDSEDCMVSRASTELMLDRFCDGKEIDFPFL